MEMKILLDGLHIRLEMEEERVSELEDGSIEITQQKEQRDKKKKRLEKSEQSLRDLWENNELSNVCVTGVPGEEISESGAENSVRT